ncbi:TIGR02594 family protein [Sphingomonas sanguinis]|uniref:TIGR02594 family protein n=1 Tax=Sphingomonas sp. LC-1 TaxID=3110957 RepID=UPI0021BA8682|nr:TIGR02594 family protein [Sphingomonas sp. LC-1]MCT8003074.1 TIGR02594 family protein [Sphingomonas sp. LC-1]
MDLGNYSWLTTIGTLPRMVSEALKIWDVREKLGPASNPVILDWAQEVGGDVARTYKTDETPWCGLTMAYIAKRAAKTPPAKPLWARNWTKFGTDSAQPDLGDIIVFKRGLGGHVGLYVGEDETHLHILGGNQGNRVCISRYDESLILAVRKPPYMNEPATARPYFLHNDGRLNSNAFADV